MPKYDGELKNRALALMEEKGVEATKEELNISTQTLYKWRREAQEGSVEEDAQSMLSRELAEKDKQIEKLEAENTDLREQISALEQKNIKYRKTIEQLIK